MPSLRKAAARERKRAKRQQPTLSGGSLRRVYPDAITKAAWPERRRRRRRLYPN